MIPPFAKPRDRQQTAPLVISSLPFKPQRKKDSQSGWFIDPSRSDGAKRRWSCLTVIKRKRLQMQHCCLHLCFSSLFNTVTGTRSVLFFVLILRRTQIAPIGSLVIFSVGRNLFLGNRSRRCIPVELHNVLKPSQCAF